LFTATVAPTVERVITFEDFDKAELEFVIGDKTVNFEYELEGTTAFLFFPEENVSTKDDGCTLTEVRYSKCEEPPEDVTLPWDISFPVENVTIVGPYESKEAGVVAEEATLTWVEDDSCDDDVRDLGEQDGRRLRRKARARGNIKTRGRGRGCQIDSEDAASPEPKASRFDEMSGKWVTWISGFLN
jgi:hypothetical protein